MRIRIPKAGVVLLLSVLAAQELIFRFLFPLPELKGFNRIHYMRVGPAGKDVAAIRSIRMVVESSPDDVRVAEALNEYGFRDGRWRTRKAPGTRRAIFIGDSYVEKILAPDGGTMFFDTTALIVAEERAGRHMYWNYDDHMRDNGYRTVGKGIFDWWSQIDAKASFIPRIPALAAPS